MPIPEKGTLEWFALSRRRCVDHMRALLSIRYSHNNALSILELWESPNDNLKAALHSACIIAYSRPFKSAKTKRQGKVSYPTRSLMAAPGFDQDLHRHMLDLRDRLIAHSDYGAFPSTMYFQTIGDEKIPLMIGINVKGLFGILARELAARYEAHLRVCVMSIEKMLQDEGAQLAAEAQLHREIFDASHNVPSIRQAVTVEPQQKITVRPVGPAASVENPSFPIGLSEYVYQTATYQIPMLSSGTYTMMMNGEPAEIIVGLEKEGAIAVQAAPRPA